MVFYYILFTIVWFTTYLGDLVIVNNEKKTNGLSAFYVIPFLILSFFLMNRYMIGTDYPHYINDIQ